MIKNIFTIRHGEAEHQVNPDIWETHTNGEIPLTALGRQQANECGKFFASMKLDPAKTMIVVSPFTRAQQTYREIARHLPAIASTTTDLVSEQDFGLFNGLSTEQCYIAYPKYAKLYDLQAETKGEYYVVPPQGESKAAVVSRAQNFINDISSECQLRGIENIIVVSHCVFNRALNMVLMGETPKWLMEEDQHDNCAVKQFARDASKWIDKGFVFVPQHKSLNNSVANIMPRKLSGVER